jgi:intergrase/recombinase
MMKTSKKEAGSKPKKSSATGKTVKSKKTTASKYVPTDEEIRANEIYFERISRGEHGTPEGDWLEAEEILRGS